MHTILFTGHMIDAPGRKTPRFPAAKEANVRAAIYEMLETCAGNTNEPLRGIAAAACGSDILFHECCKALNIASEIYLALPPKDFEKASVSFAGKEWVNRYNQLLQDLPVHVLGDADDAYHESVWEKANDRMLQEALVNGGNKMTLLAVWDGNPGDGKGGTQHMIAIARHNLGNVCIIDINKLCA